MPNGELAAAKVHGSNSSQGDREFQTEVSVQIHSFPWSVHNGDNRAVLVSCFQVSLLGRLHHRNLVNLTGYCVDKSHRMLIYEFMSNGSLENLLYGGESSFVFFYQYKTQQEINHKIFYFTFQVKECKS